MRPIKVTKNFINSAENSVLYESGNTKVLVTVSVSTRLPAVSYTHLTLPTKRIV